VNAEVTTRESLVPSLIFNGDAEAALELYQEALGGDVQITRFAGSPSATDVPEQWAQKVLFGQLQTPDGVVVTAMDAPPSRAVQIGGNVALYYHCRTNERARAIFETLSEGGSVRMPLGKTFFSDAFGMLADRFGISWMIDYRA
jgi:PhnB protein